MKTIKNITLFILISSLISCAQTHEDEHDNAIKQDSIRRAESDKGMTLDKEKMQYDTMMHNTIDRMNAMLRQMDSRYHTMKLSDTAKWVNERTQFANQIELLQKREDELRATSQADWVNYKQQSDTIIFDLKKRLDLKMNSMNLK